MMAKPFKVIKNHPVEIAIWKGDYKGKTTWSFTLQKSYKKDGKWENTNFFNKSDLNAIIPLVQSVIIKMIDAADGDKD